MEASTTAEFPGFASAGAAVRADQELHDVVLAANTTRSKAREAGGAASGAVSRRRRLRRKLCLNSRHLRSISARGFAPSPFGLPMVACRRYDIPASSYLDLFHATLVSAIPGGGGGQDNRSNCLLTKSYCILSKMAVTMPVPAELVQRFAPALTHNSVDLINLI